MFYKKLKKYNEMKLLKMKTETSSILPYAILILHL